MKPSRYKGTLCFTIMAFLWALSAHAEIERFTPRQNGNVIQLWRITNDPTMRDWALYHAQNCWSLDGRYICYEHYPLYFRTMSSEVRVYDFLEDRTIRFERAGSPRWAHNHNWLFYVHWPEGMQVVKFTSGELFWRDFDNGKSMRLSGQAWSLGTTDWRDEWLYANQVTLAEGERSIVGLRIRIMPKGPIEELPVYGQLEGNPCYPKFHTRVTNSYIPFRPTRIFFDPDGSNVSIASPVLQQCHQSWSGGGSYYLHGNGPVRGRFWDEPFPSNLHFLAAIGVGDICRCGRNDRWVLGSDSYSDFELADLRSGDGWRLMQGLSFIHDSPNYSYSRGSEYHDCDAKGSPDGTKICFVSNYDLKDGPLARITKIEKSAQGWQIHVDSTEGFPKRGCLTIPPEILAYARKTATTFEGLTRGINGESIQELPCKLGDCVTSFDARLIPEDRRSKALLPSEFLSDEFVDRNAPLMWQRRTDVYVAIVRRPDRPYLRRTERGVELIPGESHWETLGYNIHRDGKCITDRPARSGEVFSLPGAGTYEAVAVEYSGLESLPSSDLEIRKAVPLLICHDKPDDFSWTSDRWLIQGREVDEQEAKRARAAIREIVHRYDGLIHLEWYEKGEIVKRHDLNRDGKAIRRLFYRDGRLVRREYHNRDGFHYTTEFFDADGFITESVIFREVEGERIEWSHWWYVKGTPVKFVAKSGSRLTMPEGQGTYIKNGDRWVKMR